MFDFRGILDLDVQFGSGSDPFRNTDLELCIKPISSRVHFLAINIVTFQGHNTSSGVEAILNGSSEIGAHVSSNIGNLICLRHF